MTPHTTAIEVKGIAKWYGDQQVLRGIDLTVPTGTVYALLGPNGAGKTTMVHILSTLITADDGEARVAGFDVRTEPLTVTDAAVAAYPGPIDRARLDACRDLRRLQILASLLVGGADEPALHHTLVTHLEARAG